MTLPAPDADAAAMAGTRSKSGAGAQTTLDAVRNLAQRAGALLSESVPLQQRIILATKHWLGRRAGDGPRALGPGQSW